MDTPRTDTTDCDVIFVAGTFYGPTIVDDPAVVEVIARGEEPCATSLYRRDGTGRVARVWSRG